MSDTMAPSSNAAPTKSYDYTIRYAVLGAAFGLLFPIVATAVVVWESGAAFSLAAFVEAQITTPLLWIIDTAPFFLGALAFIAGRRQAEVETINATLEQRVADRVADLDPVIRRTAERRARWPSDRPSVPERGRRPPGC